MTERVLVPLDSSPQATEAFEYALSQHGDAVIILLHVIDPIEAGYTAEAMLPSYSEDWYESRTAEAEELFDEAAERATEAGVEIQTSVEVGRPSRVIVEYADDEGVDHVVMGSHGRTGVGRVLLGSVAETVVRRSPVPVTVVR